MPSAKQQLQAMSAVALGASSTYTGAAFAFSTAQIVAEAGIHCKVDGAADVDWYVLWTTDGAEFDTESAVHAYYLGKTDGTVENPAAATFALPTFAQGGKVHAKNNTAAAVTIDFEIVETVVS